MFRLPNNFIEGLSDAGLLKWLVRKGLVNLESGGEYTSDASPTDGTAESATTQTTEASAADVEMPLNDDGAPMSPLEAEFIKELNANQCQWRADTGSAEKSHRYYFDFQGGHFIAAFYKPYNVFELLFMSVASVDINDIDVLRAVCNHFNNLSIYHRFYYTKDEADTEYSLHISMTCTSASNLNGRLVSFFPTRRDLTDALAAGIRQAQERDYIDLEVESAINDRETFLLQEMELRHQALPVPRESEDTALTVGEMMRLFVETEGTLTLTRLEIIAEDARTVVEDAEVADYALHKALGVVMPAVGDIMAPRFERSFATVILTTVNNGVRDPKPQRYIIALTADGTDSTTLYYRVRLMTPSPVARRDRSLQRETSQLPIAYDFLMAYDLTSPEKKLAEFKYMWKEAQAKASDKNAEMSGEEELICQMYNPSDAFNGYWGRRYFAQGRYVEALRHFLNVYEAMRLRFFYLKDDAKDAFLEVCYYIGFCYDELGRFDLGYYYLEQVRETGRMSHCIEFVNNVVNAGDIRCFNYIDQLHMQLAGQYDDFEEDAPDHVKRLDTFLRRRRAYASIDFGDLNHAEKEFKALLDDPLSRDYAIDELAYIKRLREKMNSPAKDADDETDRPK